MKKLILLTLLSMAFSNISAITVEELFNKYKDIEDAQYTITEKDQLTQQVDSVKSESDKRMLKNLNSVETLMFMVDEDQRQQLTEDLNALEGYTLAESFTYNEQEEEPLPGIKGILYQEFNPTLNAEIYCRDVEGDSLVQPLIVFDMMGFTAMCFLDGKMPLEDVKNSINFSINEDYDDDWDIDDDDDDDDDDDEDDDAIEMSYYSDLLKRGEYLIAIDNTLMPEIKTQLDAAAYLKDHGIGGWRQELILGRDNVKTFFPDTDAELVFNYVTVIQ